MSSREDGQKSAPSIAASSLIATTDFRLILALSRHVASNPSTKVPVGDCCAVSYTTSQKSCLPMRPQHRENPEEGEGQREGQGEVAEEQRMRLPGSLSPVDCVKLQSHLMAASVQ